MNNKSDNDSLASLLTIYSNYLYALQERREYGDKYGDTDEIIEMYEKKLEKYKIKKFDEPK